MSTRFRTGPLVVALVAVPSLAVGCTAGGGDGDESFSYRPPTVETVETVQPGVRLPFDDFQLSVTDRTRLQEGQARLLQACMAARGFSVRIGGDYLRPAEPEPRFAFSDVTMWGGPFGTMPLEHARRFGYKPAPDGPFVKGPGFYFSTLQGFHLDSGGAGSDDATQSAFYGSDSAGRSAGEDGCLEEVEARLEPLVDTTGLRADLSDLARQHPRVEEATRAWSRCMRDRGHRYSDVWKASARYGLAAVDERQIEVAVDDVECTTRSGWASYFYAVLADYQRQALDHDPSLMESAYAAEQARLADVERELAG